MKGNPVGHSLRQSSTLHIFVITFLVFLGITGLRGKGYLESAELDAYDWSLRLRPTKVSLKPPITVVAITDQDIRKLGSWPVTDEVLAKSLNMIMQQHPRAIGVDMYRDLEVPPGRQALNQMLNAHPEIFIVMKFGEIEKVANRLPPIWI